LIIEKWFDDVFVWSSENGNITVEIPFGWYTPRKNGGTGDSPLTQWKNKHRKELNEFKRLSGDKNTLKQWRKEKKKESILKEYHIYKRWY
jgi:hypothetical protein